MLAKEFGPYPKYDNRVLDSDFFKFVAGSESIKLVKSYGLRNSQLLTCAPTGSLASLFNTSGSAEAIFATSYNRKTISLNNEETIYKIYPKIIQDFINSGYTEETLPKYVVTAHQVPYKNRLEMQAALNMYIDASISSTCNVPENISVNEIADLYMYAWQVGCKGVTIWRDNCSREAILTTTNDKPENLTDSIPIFNSISPISRKQLGTTIGATHCKKCACGTLYITTNLDKDGNLVEVFTHTSKGGICQANLNSNTRLISLALRSGVKIDEIEDQLKGIHCPACQMAKSKGHQIDGLSCPDIISRTIKEFVDSGWTLCQQINEEEKPITTHGPKCPECGEPLQATSGCWSCQSCGYSRCG
jgi:ribonucleoside-diphosphate reductase alpha chain